MLIETKLSNITWEFFLIMIYIFNLNKIMFKRIKKHTTKNKQFIFRKIEKFRKMCEINSCLYNLEIYLEIFFAE